MKIITLFTLLIWAPLSFSQQDPIFTMFWNNYGHFNPSLSGFEYGHDANIGYRTQWRDTKGGSKTAYANYNTIVADRHGVGINYSYDQIGFSKIQMASLNYNYQFKLKSKYVSKLSVGLAPGWTHHLMEDILIAPSPTPDPSLLMDYRANYFNLNVGATYLRNRSLIGFGVSRAVSSNNSVFQFTPHYYAHARTNLILSRNAILTFEGLAKTDNINIVADFNARTRIRNKFLLGLGYRTTRSINAIVGYYHKGRYRIGYSFDYWFSAPLAVMNATSHEFTLGMRIK